MAAPGSRGALLNVWTTVASPNVSLAAHHLVMGSRMSRTAGHLGDKSGAGLHRSIRLTLLCPARARCVVCHGAVSPLAALTNPASALFPQPNVRPRACAIVGGR